MNIVGWGDYTGRGAAGLDASTICIIQLVILMLAVCMLLTVRMLLINRTDEGPTHRHPKVPAAAAAILAVVCMLISVNLTWGVISAAMVGLVWALTD